MSRPHPSFSQRHDKLITVRAYLKGQSKSDVIKEGVNKLFDTLTDKEIVDYLRMYDTLTEEQKKNPQK